MSERPKPVRIGLLGTRHGRRRLRRAARRAGRGGRGGDRTPARDRRRADPRERRLRRDPRRSDLIVELIGGTDPARELRARRAAGRTPGGHREQAAARPARRRALRCRPRGRRAAALRGGGRGRDPDRADDPGELRRRPRSTKVFGIVNGTTNFILTEMASTGAAYEDVLARAQELGYAEADPTDDVSGADAAAKMAILARLAFHTPVTLDQVSYEGIEQIQPDDLAYAKELGLSLKLLGVAERRDGGDQRPRLPLLPLRRPPAGSDRRPVQRGHGRGAGDHRGDDVGAGGRGTADRLGRARRRRLDPHRRRACARDARAPADRRRRHLLLLPPPRGRRPPRRAGHGRDRCSATTTSR